MIEPKKTIEYITLFSILSFVFGFFIWNIHLNRFGFSESKIIQTKFILTGAFTVLFVALITLIVILRFQKLFKSYSEQPYKVLVTFVILLFFYILFIFPFFVPAWLGGGMPQTLSIIGSKEQIDELAKITIPRGTGSEVQTGMMCIAYENDDSFIVLLNDRILQLEKENIGGFATLSREDRKSFRKTCRVLSARWLFPLSWWNFAFRFGFVRDYIYSLPEANCKKVEYLQN